MMCESKSKEDNQFPVSAK